MANLIWIHDEALRHDHPVFTHDDRTGDKAGDTKAVYVWDDAYMANMHMGIKQRVFIYEALCELPLEIYEGNTASVLTELADGGVVQTAATPNKLLQQVMDDVGQSCRVVQIHDDVFAHLKTMPALKRFFKYWNAAKSSAMQPQGGTPDLFSDHDR